MWIRRVAMHLGLSAILAVGSLGAWAAPGAASAPLRGGTLGRIAETGTINLGHRESSVPFSYYDGKRQVVGYAHELMLRVVDEIKAELKLPALTLRLVPVTSQNRIPLVMDGTVDLECGSTSNTAERGRQVAFSTSFFVIGTRLLVRRGSPIKDFPDLVGRKVVVTAGTTSERLLRQWSEQPGRKVQLLAARDHDDAFRVLESGQVDALMLDDALLFGERAKAARPDDWVITGTPMSQEAYGCMMRLGDPAFKAVVDRALTRLLQSGEAMSIYTRWFQRPIPPRQLNLDFPPSEALQQLFRRPSDQPL
ncbi:transporter substrate-binding domain-containing protein [Ideonella sp. 4Y16]|uniref:Transporter substrate-binding domain-containing protein n=1 Tax=Ideonella alba TaxID=2824118 RepID=A0A940YER0_9BURK|nr:transporter substrate-binding domain-containing protein [Ideonella alba]MBQ0931856.1 transporter substrate-binding domain-containing protein [Ideonella alba]MBQ0946291.1 transporter substrate-binding domain-containing protein [Ideonella alba]